MVIRHVLHLSNDEVLTMDANPIGHYAFMDSVANHN
jgi:hypothetical protein